MPIDLRPALVPFLTAFAAVAVLTPLVIRLAERRGWMAAPKADRWHDRPTALMGGLAIFGGWALAVAFGLTADAWWIVGGGALLFVAGVVDDRVEMSAPAKLLVQIVAAVLPLVAGYQFGIGLSLWVAVPLSFLWVIGITNAVNLMDSMDGVAAGIAAIAAATLGVVAAIHGDVVALPIAWVLAGACLGFLIYNFNPAKVFMGDSGSLFIGYTLAALTLRLQSHGTTVAGQSAAAFALAAVLAVPILDTTTVTVLRVLNGRRVSQGGRDHIAHRFVFSGFSERQTAFALYATSTAFSALALSFYFTTPLVVGALAVVLLAGTLVVVLHLASADVYGERVDPETAIARLVGIVHAFAGRQWKTVFGMLLDLALVAAAFYLAHVLRFETGVDAAREAHLIQAMPLVVGLKVAIFYATGLYHGLWRHAGTSELVRIGVGTSAASLATAALLWVVDPARFSSGVLFIDWMLITFMVTGVRLGFRGVRQYLLSQRRGARRVLLYGAGDAGALVARELRQNPSHGFTPVGFIDDDPFKRGMGAQGLRVLGSARGLRQAMADHRVDAVVLTTDRIPAARRTAVAELCESLDIECLELAVSFSQVSGPTAPLPEPPPRVSTTIGVPGYAGSFQETSGDGI